MHSDDGAPAGAGLRVLVTGGAGYVGSACLRALLKAGHEAWALDDLSAGNAAAVPDGRLFEGDVRERAWMTDLMRRLRVTAVIHAAALASVPESLENPGGYWSVNLDGTRAVLDAMTAAGAARLVMSSTAAVYRPGLTAPIREDDPLDPETPYGASKLAAELAARDHARRHGLQVMALRYFNAAGADADGLHGEARARETHVIPLLLDTALGRRPVFEIFGTRWPTPDGACVRDYVSITDLARAHRLALTAPAPAPFTVCNLGAGAGVSVLELVDAVRAITGRSVSVREAAPRPGDPAVLVADISRAHAVLGWRPGHSALPDILASAWAWRRSHPNGYDAPARAGTAVS